MKRLDQCRYRLSVRDHQHDLPFVFLKDHLFETFDVARVDDLHGQLQALGQRLRRLLRAAQLRREYGIDPGDHVDVSDEAGDFLSSRIASRTEAGIGAAAIGELRVTDEHDRRRRLHLEHPRERQRQREEYGAGEHAAAAAAPAAVLIDGHYASSFSPRGLPMLNRASARPGRRCR